MLGKQPLEFYLREDWNEGGYVFLAREGNAYLNQMTWTVQPEGFVVQPAAVFEKQDMQNLFNKLWELGFRPKDGAGNSGHVAAIQYHLEDMRKLVFKATQP